MVRFSVLLVSTIVLGVFMFATGMICFLRGFALYKKEDAHNAFLQVLLASLLFVFGPVVMAVEQSLKTSNLYAEPESSGARKRPGPCLRHQSQNTPPPRLRRRHC